MLHLLRPRLLRWRWLDPAGMLGDVDEMHHACSERFLTPWAAQINTRAEVRQRYSIRGGACGDCFKSWCCRSCTLTQERREIEVEEYSFSR
jgi:Cys-rich protein (TIGR01571 family)